MAEATEDAYEVTIIFYRPDRKKMVRKVAEWEPFEVFYLRFFTTFEKYSVFIKSIYNFIIEKANT